MSERRAGSALRGAGVSSSGLSGGSLVTATGRSESAAEAAFGVHVPACSSRESPRHHQQIDLSGHAARPELWVTKWVDYSSKYGVGYILSDGSIGVYFNDSTKILLVANGDRFDYVTRRTQDKPELRSTHSFEDFPEDLKKKVTLLRHFKNYMLTDILEKKDGATVGESALAPSQEPRHPPASGEAPYVKKWTRNKHAIMFQLSNKIVQVVFFDKTEAVLSSKSHTVTYVDKRGQVCSYPLSNVLDVPSPELAKRLRYIKDILVNLLGARTTDLAGVH
jgi:polo-like kinase 1